MTSRERLLAALDGNRPDRLPVTTHHLMPSFLGKRMGGISNDEFFDRFVNIAAPRIRDFRGFSRDSFDGRGCYNLGLTEQTMFPEIEYDKVKKVFGMDIAIVTTAKNDEDALALLEKMGMPFTRKT